MRKKVLFVAGCLDSGGVAKSIVTLMNVIDRKKYDIHLLILSPVRGPFCSQLPSDITIHRNHIIELLLSQFSGVWKLLKMGYLFLALGSLLRLAISRINKAYAGWLLAKLMPRAVDEEFDVIVDYAGQHVCYYMVDKLKGKKKISYFHDDYSAWDYYKDMDRIYLPKVDHVVVITEHCRQSMIEYFPNIADKIHVIENVVLPDLITAMSKESVPEEDFLKNHFVLLTVGHVSEKKGFDFALTASKILNDRGVDFRWVFVGTYEEKHRKMVEEMGLQEMMLFYGVRPNPYPYFRLADIVVHPARYESQAIVVSEARLLCKPIVVTRFSTVKDILLEGVNASVAEMNGESLADKIYELTTNQSLRESYVDYTRTHITNNSSVVENLYKLLDS